MALFAGMPFPVQFFLAFVIVLGLIGATAWAARRLGGGRLGAALRARQPRLAVTDYASVDGRRRLILVRRDNVEHLVMIGGPTDFILESNIACGAPVAERALAVSEPMPRPIPLPEGAMPEAAARIQRAALTARADELSYWPGTSPRGRMPANARLQPEEPRPDARQETSQERQEPRLPPPQSVEPSPTTDQILAEIAHQLEAALRKPPAKEERKEARELRPAAMPRAEPVAGIDAPAAPPPPAVAVALSAPPPVRANVAESKPPRGESKSQASGKRVHDSFEQEMASLLGRSSANN